MKLVLKIFSVLFFGILLVFLFSSFSKSKNQSPSQLLTRPVVTVINPIRGPQLGLENVNLLDSLKVQWQATKDTHTFATWLWQYSAMEDPTLVQFAKSQMKNQEFGLFLETERNSSAKSGVLYRGRGPWYFSDGLLLLSYDQAERRKLIDTAFTKFKKTFGYYPKTVGAWWVGADSLQYMKEKYHIVASLQVADQYDLDVYSVWGQPWSIPYLASKNNAAVPATSFDQSLGVVIMQWAPRDPTYGYGNTPAASTYSMQDYYLKKYDFSYVDYLLSVFLKGPGDQVVMGVESGLSPDTYNGDYKTKLIKLYDLKTQKKIDVLTARDFANNFLSQQQVFGTNAIFLSKAFTSNDQSFWYNSGNFRAGIEKQGKNIYLVDVRDYLNAGSEDFDLLPNSQGYLRVASPAVIDSARTPFDKILIGSTNSQLRVQKHNDQIIVTDGQKNIAIFTKDSIKTSARSFVFQKQTRPLNVFLLLFSLLLLYILVLLATQKDKKVVYINAAILFVCLLTAYPFFSSGDFKDTNFVLNQKTLVLFPILRFIPFDPSVGLLLVFQFIPFLLLLVLSFLFLMKRKLMPVYIVGIFLYLFFYSHMPSAFVTEFITKKKLGIIIAIGFYLLVALIICIVVWYKKKKYLLQTFLLLSVEFVIFISTLLLPWQTFIITPFEMKSLQFVSSLHKDVYFVMPKEMPVYRAVEPVLNANDTYGESLTKTHWKELVRPEGKFLMFPDLKSHIIFVPRYLGADLYPEEIKQYGLKKVFDNTQIQIYSL